MLPSALSTRYEVGSFTLVPARKFATSVAVARNGSQRIQPPPDAACPIQNVRAGQGLPVRLSPTAAAEPVQRDPEHLAIR